MWLRMRPTATRRTLPHPRVYLALLPSGPDAVRRLKLTRVRAAVRRTLLPGPTDRQTRSVLRNGYCVEVARGAVRLLNTASMNMSVVQAPLVAPNRES